MFPRFSVYGVPNCSLVKPVFFRDNWHCCTCGVFVTNLNNEIVCKFCHPLPLTTSGNPMIYSISHVRLSGIPSKVGQAVICWFSIIVATLHSVWAWANKCHQDKSVNKVNTVLNVNAKVTTFSGPKAKHLYPSISNNRFCASSVVKRNFFLTCLNAIIAFYAIFWESWNVAVFDVFNRIVFSHFHLLIRWLWSGQSGASTPYCPNLLY